MKTTLTALLFMMIVVFSSPAYSISGKIDRIYNYSYIDGLQVYWKTGYTPTSPATSCPNPSIMTVRGDTTNGKTMVSMIFVALSAGKTLNCTPKADCSGINGTAEANYCYMTTEG